MPRRRSFWTAIAAAAPEPPTPAKTTLLDRW